MNSIRDLHSHGFYLNLSSRELSIKRDLMIKHGLPFKDNTPIAQAAFTALSVIAALFIKLAFDSNFTACLITGSAMIASLAGILYATKQPAIPSELKMRIFSEELLIKQIDHYKLNWTKAKVLNSIDPFNFDNPNPLLTLDELDHFVFGDSLISYSDFVTKYGRSEVKQLSPRRIHWLRDSFGTMVKNLSLGWVEISKQYSGDLDALKMTVKEVWPFIKENELKLTFASLVNRNGHGIRWYFTQDDRAIMGPKFLYEFFTEIDSSKMKPLHEDLRVLAQEAADLNVWEAFIDGLKERKLIECSSNLVCLRQSLVGYFS